MTETSGDAGRESLVTGRGGEGGGAGGSRLNAAGSSASPTRLRRALACALIAAAILPYIAVYDYPFVRYDDGLYVTDRPEVQAGLTWDGAVWAFTTGISGTWQPVTWISHMVDCAVFGLWAGGHHLTNVALHALNTVLLFLTLIVYTRDRGWRSAFVAAVFAVHPLHVESVAWVAERKDVLSTAFWWATMLCYAGYVRAPSGSRARAMRYGGVLICLALGLMAKPMLVTLPAALLLMDYWPLGRIGVRPDRRWLPALAEKAPLFALAGAAGVATVATQYGLAVSSLEGLPLAHRVENAVVAYAWYLWKTIAPTNLAVYYPHPRGATPGLTVAASALLLIGLTAWAIAAARRRPHLFVGWFWYVGTLVPVIGLLQVGTQGMADRYTYVPMTGLLIAAAWAVPGGTALRRKGRATVAITAAAAIAALGATAHGQVRTWRDTVTLFTHAARVVPNNAMAHFNAGSHLREAGRLDEALVHLEAALAIDPRDGAARRVYAQALTQAGRADAALRVLTEGVAAYPADAATRSELGALLLRMGRIEEALAQLEAAAELDSELAEAQDNLAAALLASGRYAEAEARLRAALTHRPEDAVVWNNLGAALVGRGRIEEAVRCFRSALTFDPENADARRNLALFGGEGQSG